MSKSYFSRGTKNTFLVPLLVASLFILGVVVYATMKNTEIRSRAANPVACTMAQKTDKGLVCPSGSLLQGNLCCTPPVPTPKRVCKTGVDSLCMNTSCRNGYRYVTVTCLDGFSQKRGDASTCKTSAQWASYGADLCKAQSPVCPTPTPTVAALPDLVPGPMMAKPNPAIIGMPVLLSFQMYNIGLSLASPAQYSYTNQAGGFSKIDSSNTCNASTSLKPKESCVSAYLFTFSSSGTKVLDIKLDPDNLVTESNETNNKFSFTLTVVSPTPPSTSPRPTPWPTTQPSRPTTPFPTTYW